MAAELLRLAEDPADTVRELRRLIEPPGTVRRSVAEIIAAVRERGDAALLEYVTRFDTGGAPPRGISLSSAELEAASERLTPAVRDGLRRAVANVGRVAEAALAAASEPRVEFGSHTVALRQAPLHRAGVYVPGGRAPYPSTVVMGVVPARAAGVESVAVCAPPGSDGEVSAAILGAAGLAGATTLYRMGGAHAIAALAYGTESVSAVDVIVGPGNVYVQEAKRQVSGDVGIDGFAGPSDLVVIADGDADPEPLALDLLAQAEHGPGTIVVGVSTSRTLLTRLQQRLTDATREAVVRLVEVADAAGALAFAEAFAPEHLELVGPEAEMLASRVTRAGSVFVGAAAGTAFGDYIAGSNHILPTGGAARFASALSVAHFRRQFTEIRIEDGSALARAAAPIARAEGFGLHARSMEARIRDNGGDGTPG